jgi:hypothetical protein
MSGWLITFIVVFVVYAYIIIPARLRARISLSADPQFEEVAPDDPRIPARVKAFFCDVAADLKRLGFDPAAYVLNSETCTGVIGYIAVFEERSARVLAAAMAAFSQATHARLLQTYAVEFSTEFADGREVNTGNGTLSQWRAPTPWRTAWRFPGMADLARLYGIHQSLIGRHGPIAKRPLPQPGEHPATLRASVLRDLQAQVAAGYMYLDSSAERFRHTWKGGLLGTWSQLWPMSTIRRWNTARRARARLRALGLTTDYEKVDYRTRFEQYSAAPEEESVPRARRSAQITRPRRAVGPCPGCGALIITDQPTGARVSCAACHRVVSVPEAGAPIRVRHSGVGIASFVLGVLAGLTAFGLLAVGVTLAMGARGEIDDGTVMVASLGLGLMGAIALALVGLVLGIGGLAQANRRKVFAILGVCCNGVVLLGIAALIVLGTLV